jgi:hypothetical protein
LLLQSKNATPIVTYISRPPNLNLADGVFALTLRCPDFEEIGARYEFVKVPRPAVIEQPVVPTMNM